MIHTESIHRPSLQTRLVMAALTLLDVTAHSLPAAHLIEFSLCRAQRRVGIETRTRKEELRPQGPEVCTGRDEGGRDICVQRIGTAADPARSSLTPWCRPDTGENLNTLQQTRRRDTTVSLVDGLVSARVVRRERASCVTLSMDSSSGRLTLFTCDHGGLWDQHAIGRTELSH